MIETLDYSKLSTDELLKLAKEYDDAAARNSTLQMAEKILLNSLYGATGNVGFRYFDLDLARSITLTGQHTIQWIERKLNEFVERETGVKKDRIILIDTDSVVLNLEDLVKVKCPKDYTQQQILDWMVEYSNNVINPYIEECYSELGDYINCFAKKFKMKRENIVSNMINIAKKNYVMEVYDSEGVRYTIDNPKWKIMGLKIVKSDLAKKVKQLLRDSLPIIMHGTEEDIQKYISECKKKFYAMDVEDIAFPKGVSNIDTFRRSYWEHQLKTAMTKEDEIKARNFLDCQSRIYVKGSPIHVKASLVYNEMISNCGLEKTRRPIESGNKIKYVYLKPNPIHEEVIAFQDNLPEEFGLKKYVDYDTMYEKEFLKTIEGMIGPCGWSTEKKNDLEDLFG